MQKEVTPKLARVKSYDETFSVSEAAKEEPPLCVRSPPDIDDDNDDKNDDCVDHSPITRNVRSMVQNFEVPHSNSCHQLKDTPVPKHRKLSGLKERNEKRRGSFPLSQKSQDHSPEPTSSPDSRALKRTDTELNIITKVSSAIKTLNDKCGEVTESPKNVNGNHSKPRPVRSQMSTLEMSSKAYRSPLNKLKINDIVVTRGSVGRDKGAARVGRSSNNGGSNSSTTSSDDSENADAAASQQSPHPTSVSSITTTVYSSPSVNAPATQSVPSLSIPPTLFKFHSTLMSSDVSVSSRQRCPHCPPHLHPPCLPS